MLSAVNARVGLRIRMSLRKVDALIDWSWVFPLLKSGLNRSGLGPPGSDEIVLFKCLLIGQWYGFYRP